MSDEKQLITGADFPVEAPVDPNDRLIWLAVQGGADLDKLERLIALKNAQEARQAKMEFDRHFAEMQAEFEAAHRDKKGYDYKYAPIETLQKQFGPVIARHGFSYRWREEILEHGKRCVMRISGWGHAEENSFDVPQIEGTKQMNPIQVAGAMSTYGRRYTFIGGFGIIIDDEDDDAQLSFDDGVKYSDYIRTIDAETMLEALRELSKKYYKELKAAGDHKGAEIVTKAYNRRKKELEVDNDTRK